MELRKQERKKQTQIKIESVSNGFIVKEDYFDNRDMCRPGEACVAPTTKVFNTKQQLKNYIDNNL